MEKEWFESWFDSPYYHILYKHRDDQEAKHFIDNLMARLQPAPKSTMLDLACGKGRHSRYLAQKGFCVTGIDLSEQNIEFARQFENEDLSFYTHDMRLAFRINYFDFIFNFFTSFGYFEKDSDHLKTLRNVAKGLNKNGILVLDYLNSVNIEKSIRKRREKIVEDIRFVMHSQVRDGFIEKKIHFEDQGRDYQFEERVRVFLLKDFEEMLAAAGLELIEVYGDYNLNAYVPEEAERLILVARKSEKPI